MPSLGETVGRLEAASGFASLMLLFRKNFPREFRRDVERHRISPLSSFEQMAGAIDCFLGALESRFPVAWGCGDHLATQLMEGATIPCLPVCTRALVEDDTGPESLRLGYRVILAVTTNDLDDLMMRPIVGAPLGSYPDYERVVRICAGKRGPLRFMADAYRYAVQATGNPFLDISDEMCAQSDPVDFTQEMIDYFTAEWEEARVILKRCDRFNDWIEADLRRVKPVVAILREAAQRERRVRVRTNGDYLIVQRGAPLTQTLAGLMDNEEEYAEEDFEDAA